MRLKGASDLAADSLRQYKCSKSPLLCQGEECRPFCHAPADFRRTPGILLAFRWGRLRRQPHIAQVFIEENPGPHKNDKSAAD